MFHLQSLTEGSDKQTDEDEDIQIHLYVPVYVSQEHNIFLQLT